MTPARKSLRLPADIRPVSRREGFRFSISLPQGISRCILRAEKSRSSITGKSTIIRKSAGFRSSCDTEVILAAYLAWGIDCVRRFNGMFAFALYDHRSGELFLARDRMGVKPLYYYLENAAGKSEAVEETAQNSSGTAGRTGIVFASELKPIMACPGFERTIRSDILATGAGDDPSL